jgi:import inner membrane translocase subunit TIM9
MSKSCFDKCVTRFKDNDLNVAEMSCVDRCVVKYMETQTLIGLKIREQSMQLMQAQQAQQ